MLYQVFETGGVHGIPQSRPLFVRHSAAGSADAQRVPAAGSRAQAGQAAGPRPREPAHHLRTHARARPRALPGQAQRHSRNGRALRRSCPTSPRCSTTCAGMWPWPGQPRRPGSHAHAAAGPARHRQDAFRAQAGRADRHRHEPGADGLDDGRLAAVGRVLAVEGRQAGQGVRGAGRWPIRQPGDRDRRDRQGQRRRAVRPAGLALQPARTRHRACVRRRIRRGADRCQPGDLDHDGERRARHSRADPQPHERVRDRGAHRRSGAADRRPAVRVDPRRARLGPALRREPSDDVLDQLADTGAARNAARPDDRLRQCAPGRRDEIRVDDLPRAGGREARIGFVQ